MSRDACGHADAGAGSEPGAAEPPLNWKGAVQPGIPRPAIPLEPDLPGIFG